MINGNFDIVKDILYFCLNLDIIAFKRWHQIPVSFLKLIIKYKV